MHGYPANGQAHVAQELAVAEGLKMPYETALSHYVLGKYIHTVKDRELHLQKAAAIFEQLGGIVDLKQVQPLRVLEPPTKTMHVCFCCRYQISEAKLGAGFPIRSFA